MLNGVYDLHTGNRQPIVSTKKARTHARAEESGGEVGIRTPESLVAITRLAGEHLRPLGHFSKTGGGSRIRTHGTLQHNSFQDCRLQPLGHSSAKRTIEYHIIYL